MKINCDDVVTIICIRKVDDKKEDRCKRNVYVFVFKERERVRDRERGREGERRREAYFLLLFTSSNSTAFD